MPVDKREKISYDPIDNATKMKSRSPLGPREKAAGASLRPSL